LNGADCFEGFVAAATKRTSSEHIAAEVEIGLSVTSVSSSLITTVNIVSTGFVTSGTPSVRSNLITTATSISSSGDFVTNVITLVSVSSTLTSSSINISQVQVLLAAFKMLQLPSVIDEYSIRDIEEWFVEFVEFILPLQLA
jgi:hypothetical protein